METQGLGKQTEEAVILACQCNSTRFSEEKRTARSVVFICAACGARTSVQGSVALARVSTDESTFAVHQHRIAPDPEASSGSKRSKGEKPSPKEAGFEYLRSKLTSGPDGQAAIVRRACEYVRIMNCDDPEYRQLQWMGTALCYICADFLSGADPRVTQVYEAQQEAVADAIWRAEDKGRKLTRKRATAIANTVRDAVAEQLGLVRAAALAVTDEQVATAQLNVERATEQATKEAAAAADDRFMDEGHLADAIINMRAELIQAKVVPSTGMMFGGPDRYAEFLKIYERKGGYLFRVTGDARTRGSAGVPPVAFVWMAEDYSEHLDLALAYEEQLDGTPVDAPVAEVVELVPANVPEDDMWEMPTFATKREEL